MESPARLTPQKLSTRAHELLRQACPEKRDEAFFNANIQVAMAHGFTWEESLQFVIRKRQELN